MPIDKAEFKNGKRYSEVEDEIIAFLNERKEKAFTSQEIMAGVHFNTDFSTHEKAEISTFAVADFTTLLHELSSEEKIETKIVEGQVYFATVAAGEGVAKCPKCRLEITAPRKVWKMTGRPDKSGRRLQLTIGLFKCPTHGSFRATLNKQKI
jgi:hypothetical protein